jgi:lysophospholipase L1-like esterase
LLEFNTWVEELCAEDGIAVTDLMESFDAFRDDLTRIYASPFDAHPNAAAHARIADALYRRILELWPNVLHPPLDDPADGQGHA